MLTPHISVLISNNRFTRPPCSPSSLCVTRCLFHYPPPSTMAVTPNDPFVVSSSTALGMSEHLLLVLNTIIKNLPESELREVRASLEETANVADDILYNMMISSTFEMLSVNEGTCAYPSLFISVLIPFLNSVHHPSRGYYRYRCLSLSCCR